MTQNLEDLRRWIAQQESDVNDVTIPAVHRLGATLGRDDPMPKLGDPLPPVPLPRRMNASRRTWMHAELRIGDEVRKEATINEVTIKQCRTGQMVFAAAEFR